MIETESNGERKKEWDKEVICRQEEHVDERKEMARTTSKKKEPHAESHTCTRLEIYRLLP